MCIRDRFQIENLKVNLKLSMPYMDFANPDFDISNNSITDSTNRADILVQNGIRENEVKMIESAITFLMPRKLFNTAFSTISLVDLNSIITGLNLTGNWEQNLFQDNIILKSKEDNIFKENKKCSYINNVPEIKIVTSKIKNVNQSYDIDIDYNLSNTPRVIRAENNLLDNLIYLYTPKIIWEKRFTDILPSIKLTETSNKIVGYRFDMSTEFKYASLKFDSARFGLIVSFVFDMTGTAFLNVDVPCIGRQDLGYSRFETTKSGELDLIFNFEASPDGQLNIVCQIDRMKGIKVNATTSFFSRWLAFAGGEGLVMGIIIDEIISSAIEKKLPNFVNFVKYFSFSTVIFAPNLRELALLSLFYCFILQQRIQTG